MRHKVSKHPRRRFNFLSRKRSKPNFLCFIFMLLSSKSYLIESKLIPFSNSTRCLEWDKLWWENFIQKPDCLSFLKPLKGERVTLKLFLYNSVNFVVYEWRNSSSVMCKLKRSSKKSSRLRLQKLFDGSQRQNADPRYVNADLQFKINIKRKQS